MSLNIVLLEPEIPQNTGNIARTCVVTDTTLHIIGPIKFSLEEKAVKRAGLDYWSSLKVYYYKNYQEFNQKHQDKNIFYATTKTHRLYSDVNYQSYEDLYIMFGKESKGIPEKILRESPENNITIPMMQIEKARSLNLSNACAVVIYEVLRQWNFPMMLKEDSDF
ncbi:tRNA (cytidine(34)-2'-O)-methyltransferase [Isachenkonia alkalipeptolytica]|uniref:Putative tRNA (cytidine(34)-2'-O)-methyltransferase n=1 Tax=Isachenkonia alkalipeptolytica TaxID=2565777 RepID=A0AA43XLW4_9CLOT|nr:tRNA (cytidine(34)-2'-O)-methyltransferase [Isachenkonia alkalipeptolytica]NBG89178.1 tRNA (cytidine(34)-2'-O)-methyltransferase [Isachenkonia alkalipeptolytica]